MENLTIPASIWLNLAVLVAAGGFVWFKLAKAREVTKKKTNQPRDRAGPGVKAGRTAG